MRVYIGQGLRPDIERLEEDTISALIASLKRDGVSDEIIQEALGEIKGYLFSAEIRQAKWLTLWLSASDSRAV
ncbi:hypothetical protein QUA40_05500 [Microcoleus sp. Pol11C3]|uniref:hypothetical protein n=1 Tax=Microcoleus sp. Pol11C3 TaxID=3055390 RepID=UPI002FD687B0